MHSTIQIYIAAGLTACLTMQPPPGTIPGDEVIILPSTLSRRDAAASEVRSWLRSLDISSHLLVPQSLTASAFGGRGSSWSTVAAEATRGTFRLPSQLAEAKTVWTVSDINEIGGRGPYVLDLPVRYANLTSRLAALGSRDRAARAVSLLQARPLTRHLIVRRFPSFTLLTVTADPIPAELFALSLVDEDLPGDAQLIGPWEDDFVQRATELELGARLPTDIRVLVHGPVHPAIEATIGRILVRMGVPGDAVMFSARE